MSQSFEKPKKKPSKQDSLSKLNDTLLLVKGDKVQTRNLKMIIDRIKNLNEK